VFFSISLHLIDNPPVILPNRRPDHGFDNLIQNIYGDITALEKQEEQEIEKLNRDKHMNNAYAESRMRGILNQAIQRRKPKTVAGVKRKASLAASSLAAHEDGNFPNLKVCNEFVPLSIFWVIVIESLPDKRSFLYFLSSCVLPHLTGVYAGTVRTQAASTGSSCGSFGSRMFENIQKCFCRCCETLSQPQIVLRTN